MTINELNQKLNAIDDGIEINVREFKLTAFNRMSIRQKLNQYLNKLSVDVIIPEGKNILLFTLFQKRYSTNNRWELDTRGNNSSWAIEYMDFYLEALKIAQEFMEDNNENDKSLLD